MPDVKRAESNAALRPRFTLIMAGEAASRWRGMEKLASRDGAISVVRCAGSVEELRVICQKLRPSVLIADLNCVRSLISDSEGISGGGLLGVRILAESAECGEHSLESLLKKGCWGTLCPDTPVRMVWKAVQSVAAGQYWVSREMLTQMARRHILAQALGLTSREIEILQLVAQGCRNQEIARRLFISVETVRWHLRSLYNKLGVHDRFSAAMFASGLAEGVGVTTRTRARLAATGSD